MSQGSDSREEAQKAQNGEQALSCSAQLTAAGSGRRAGGEAVLRILRLFAATLILFSVSAQAQSLEQVAAQREAKLEGALERLRELRDEIQSEQIPLARELNEKEARAGELADEVERVRRLRDSRSVELETLRSRVEAREREIDYVRRTLLPEYVADFEANLSTGERGRFAPLIRGYNLLLEDPETDDAEKLAEGLALIERSLEQTRSLLGGKRYSGEALSPEGDIRSGDFLQVGPLLYFAAGEGDLVGLVEETTSLDARVLPLEDEAAEAVAAAARSGSGVLPVDPTLGDALALEGTKDTLLEHLDKGGVWVYPILLFALAATLVAVVKTIQVFSIRHPKPMVIHDIVKALREGRKKDARELAAAQPQPARDMLLAAVDHADESVEMVEEVMYESMLGTQPRLERFLNVIAVTAAAAPLLGLLGTVTGIIKTFRLMTVFGAGDPKPLISGISEALITTELGLVLAIPALVLHALLSRKVAGVMAYLEKSAVTFANGLSRST